jgi:succinate dehydrogenase / fumarate reductase iron-sulfur subunit
MLINGKPRQSCTALIETLMKESGSATIVLAPFTKFPLVKDLVVDRTQLFNSLKKVNAWVTVDGTWDSQEKGVKVSPEVQEALYVLSTCMTCGCCSEACPQVNEESPFMGPSAISQIRLFNSNPPGALQKPKRLRAAMEEDGIAGCGNAQNCIKVCPKKIPLTESIALIGREATKQAFRDSIGLPDATN